jgi:hypothetical protein
VTWRPDLQQQIFESLLTCRGRTAESMSRHHSPSAEIKVFCFFSSEKKILHFPIKAPRSASFPILSFAAV